MTDAPKPLPDEYRERFFPPSTYITGVGQTILFTHSPDLCEGRPCVIHNPSDHHMRDWPTNWRGDRRMMERICPHGIGHPDPDDITTDTVHGCDGCCIVPGDELAHDQQKLDIEMQMDGAHKILDKVTEEMNR